MKSYLSLIGISGKVHRRRNRMTLFCITIAVFLVTGIFSMAEMEILSQRSQAMQQNGSWHTGFTNIDAEAASLIQARPDVETAGWYGVLSEGDGLAIAGKSTWIIGMGEALATGIFEPVLSLEEGFFPSAPDEAAVTSDTALQLGLSPGDTITVTGPDDTAVSLKITGLFNNSVRLMREDNFGVLVSQETFADYFSIEGSSWQFYVRFRPAVGIQQAIADILTQHGIPEENSVQNMVYLGTLGQSKDPTILMIYMSAAVLSVLVLLSGVFMISGSLNSSVLNRTKFFGMMRCLGATRGQIMRFVRREALYLCRVGIPAGIFLGVSVSWILCAALRVLSPKYFDGLPVLGLSAIGIFSGLVVGLMTVLIASGTPARKAAGVSALTAVSGNAHHLPPVRTPANASHIPVTAALGMYHARASMKTFFLMVGSFSLSIILFLCFSSTIDFMNHALRPLKPWTPDISIASPDNTCSIPQELPAGLQKNEVVKRVYGRMFAYDIPALINDREQKAMLISYEQNQFDWAEDMLINGSLDGALEGGGMLAVYSEEFALTPESTISLTLDNDTADVKISGILSHSPFTTENGVAALICSEETFRKLTGETGYTIIDLQLTAEANAQDALEIRNAAGPGVTFSDSRDGNREARGSYYGFALCVYGFLVIIALITACHIFNSMSLSVSARMKQYGALRAIGMSDRQLLGMILTEALTYAVAGSIVGCSIGILLHKFLYESMITFHWGTAWYLPVNLLLLILSIVLLSALLSVIGPVKRIRSMSIVDTIGSD